jgi:uncharacterized protein
MMRVLSGLILFPHRYGALAPLLCALVFALVAVTIAAIPATAAAQSGAVRSLLEMRHDRVVVQEWDLSCGAAALSTLLRYQHNDMVEEREVALGLMGREEYVANPALVQIRQGFSLLDLKRYVDARGYEGIGYGKLTIEDLIERAPVMVPINTNGYNHFVVFRGIAGSRVLLADPAWGNRTMTVDKFKQKWLDYPEFGHVGFVVATRTGDQEINRLAPRPDDFVMLR